MENQLNKQTTSLEIVCCDDSNNESKLLTHQELGEIMDLFMVHEFTPGSVFLTRNGTKIWRALEGYFRNEYKIRGYDEVMTPQLANIKLWKQSSMIKY